MPIKVRYTPKLLYQLVLQRHRSVQSLAGVLGKLDNKLVSHGASKVANGLALAMFRRLCAHTRLTINSATSNMATNVFTRSLMDYRELPRIVRRSSAVDDDA